MRVLSHRLLATLEPPAEMPEKPLPPLQFMGSKACTTCHAHESQLWENSHHDLAMQEANEATVLGNFNNTTLTNFGVTSRFYKQAEKFFVQTDGPDGTLTDYEITYTFGATPLQQYLIEFPGETLSSAKHCLECSSTGRRRTTLVSFVSK